MASPSEGHGRHGRDGCGNFARVEVMMTVSKFAWIELGAVYYIYIYYINIIIYIYTRMILSGIPQVTSSETFVFVVLFLPLKPRSVPFWEIPRVLRPRIRRSMDEGFFLQWGQSWMCISIV